MEECIIRPGKREDLEDVFSLVMELAIYEKEADAVITHIDDYQKAFDQGLIKIIVAEHFQDGIVGMCLGFTAFSTWKGKMMFLEDFVVKESHRRLRLGERLWNEFIVLSKLEGCKLLKWQVLDWNEPAIKFYEKKKAVIDKNWWSCRLFFDE
jgi:GNAT superfamily N-acetyltransferase